MNLAEFSIKNQLLCVIAILLALVGGWNAYQTMPRFEDPEFTIRSAIIYTQYPGASPEQVALEVSDPLETALQELQEIDEIATVSSTGLSEVRVEIKYEFSKTKEDLQIVWTKLRNKMNDVQSSLPVEAGVPLVNDDFGDLYGLSYFIVGDEYSYAELRSYAKELQKDILQVKGVGKVEIAGTQDEAIYIEFSPETTANLGVSIEKLYDILKQQNSVVFAGNVNIGNQRLSIDPSGDIDSVESIKNLLVSNDSDGKILYLKDIAEVYRDYKTPFSRITRYNGKKAVAIGVSNVSGGNVVDVGYAVDAKLRESESRRPLGIEVHEYYHQGKVVEASVNNFVFNVLAALIIVIASLLFTMGLRSALVISFILLVTVGATLTTMQIIESLWEH
jgi:multidrug efflux pump subunit AcrB